MELEKQAQEFIKRKAEKLEPIAVHCNSCGRWSGYNIENNHRLPKGWREDEKGYHCNECRKHKIKRN